jgi:hypothetical protein
MWSTLLFALLGASPALADDTPEQTEQRRVDKSKRDAFFAAIANEVGAYQRFLTALETANKDGKLAPMSEAAKASVAEASISLTTAKTELEAKRYGKAYKAISESRKALRPAMAEVLTGTLPASVTQALGEQVDAAIARLAVVEGVLADRDNPDAKTSAAAARAALDAAKAAHKKGTWTDTWTGLVLGIDHIRDAVKDMWKD